MRTTTAVSILALLAASPMAAAQSQQGSDRSPGGAQSSPAQGQTDRGASPRGGTGDAGRGTFGGERPSGRAGQREPGASTGAGTGAEVNREGRDRSEKSGSGRRDRADDRERSDDRNRSARERDRDGDRSKSARDRDRDGNRDRSTSARERDRDRDGSSATGRASGAETGGKDRQAIREIPQEKKTRVRTVFSKHRHRSADVDVNISVGVTLPRRVRLYAIPEEIVVIAPAYRSYRYFVVDNRICIVDPDTYEIVEIIILA